MLRRVTVILAVPVAVLAAAGCGGDDSGLTFEDPKGTVAVERGMEFTLEFSVNASVGYDWKPAAAPPRARLAELKRTDVHYENPDSAGDSGVKRFTYTAADRAGRETMVFDHLYRGDLKDRRTITLEVR